MAFFKKIFGREKQKLAPKVTEDNIIVEEKSKRKEASVKKGRVIVGVLRRPHITEKTANLAKENKYAFLVGPRANKVEVRRAVEAKYGSAVARVHIINAPGKERRRGRQIGWKPGFKKAIVTLKEGQTIEIQ